MKREIFVTPDANANTLVGPRNAPEKMERELTKYLDALQERDRLTPLSELGQSFRALDRNGATHVAAHYATLGATLGKLPTMRLGKLNPAFAQWDPSLPVAIKRAARDGAHMSRFDRGSSERMPLKPNEKPREKTRQIFYLGKGTVLQDTVSARTIAGEPIHATRLERKRAASLAESATWDATTTLLTLCASVAVTGVDAIASAIVRLDAANAATSDIIDACFRELGHSARRKLAKAIPVARAKRDAALARHKAE
jgi:hypothetical protein